MLKKIFAGIMITAALTGCTTAAQPTYKKEFTRNDYNHKTHEYTCCTWNTSETLLPDDCIVTLLEYNPEHNYYTVWAFSNYYNETICIADDITPETAQRCYIPGTKLVRFYSENNPYYVQDIKIIEKP